MAKKKWTEITREDVIKAIHVFELENPIFPEPKSTFLLYDGKKYPAKHIRGMAYEVHYNEKILKSEYTGGAETVRFFERLGFDTQYTHKSINTHPIRVIKSDKDTKAQIKDADACTLEKHPIEVPKLEIKKNSLPNIKIPVKGVVEQKNALQLLLNKICDGDIVCEKTYSWMKTPKKFNSDYKKIYDSIVEYRGNKEFAKKNVSLRCDFVCESKKLIIEYDERQHFSEARRRSLLAYSNLELCYDYKLWCKACEDIQAKDNHPINRDEIRAFYDSVRDIEATKNGYKLVRIMHGQIDFEASDAEEKLWDLLNIHTQGVKNIVEVLKESSSIYDKVPIKIGLYLQTDDSLNSKKFHKAMSLVRESDIDILVFPEFSYVTGMMNQLLCGDYFKDGKMELLIAKALEFSKNIGKAVVLGNKDGEGRIVSIFANAMASSAETGYKVYVKHTMTEFSAFDFEDYHNLAQGFFKPILYKGYRIGQTICYDCNHSVFSRKYGMNGVDIILNSTGGDVKFDKWHKYNKARAIENNCFTFVTMGGPAWGENMHNYVYGFTPQGKEMTPTLLNGTFDGRKNISGGIYVYDTAEYDGTYEVDQSIDQKESVNKKIDYTILLSDIKKLEQMGENIAPKIRTIKHGKENIIFCFVDGSDIMKPEKVLELLYKDELRKIPNKRYVLINRWEHIDLNFYESQLSVILKVRSMENFCAVLLVSDNMIKCFQCGMNRTAQIVKEVGGKFGVDLSRTGGPETIWRNKLGMKAIWRKNIEWLIASIVEKN